MVRLGAGLEQTGIISEEALDAGSKVCSRYAAAARDLGAETVASVATSAVRDAANQTAFLERVRREAHLHVRVLPGEEEARLSYLGVLSGFALGDCLGLFIDVGGGSVELTLADAEGPYRLLCLPLGAIRLTERFLGPTTDPVPADCLAAMVAFARAMIRSAAGSHQFRPADVIFAAGGTSRSLARVTSRRLGAPNGDWRNGWFAAEDLRDSVATLAALPLQERRHLPGLDPVRADIILGGAATLMAMMDVTGAPGLVVSDRGLRQGVILETFGSMGCQAHYSQSPLPIPAACSLAS